MAAFRSNKKPYIRSPPAGPRSTNDNWVHDKHDEQLFRQPAAAHNGPNRLVVSNLHYEVGPKDLTSIFGQIGTVNAEIKYDRSGRSNGVAIIEYETSAEAALAKQEYNGILAKGQPMTIVFDKAPRPIHRSVSAPTPNALLNRIQKPALLDRFAVDDSALKTSSGPRGGAGPIRTKKGRNGNGNAPGKKTAGAPKPPRNNNTSRKPRTAEELDKELDSFNAAVADVNMS